MPDTNPNILVGVITHKNRWREHAYCKRWLEACGLPYFFIVGDAVSTCYEDKHVLHVPVKEAYENLPLKVHHFARYCAEHYEFDYLLKIDDNTAVNPKTIGQAPFGHYCGRTIYGGLNNWHTGKCQDKRLNQTNYWGKWTGAYCDGGGGYFLSRHAAHIIGKPEFEWRFAQEIYEDKTTGDVLREHNIPPLTIKGMYSSYLASRRSRTRDAIVTINTTNIGAACYLEHTVFGMPPEPKDVWQKPIRPRVIHRHKPIQTPNTRAKTKHMKSDSLLKIAI